MSGFSFFLKISQKGLCTAGVLAQLCAYMLLKYKFYGGRKIKTCNFEPDL